MYKIRLTLIATIIAVIGMMAAPQETKAYHVDEYLGYQPGTHNWGEGLQHCFLRKHYDDDGILIGYEYWYVNFIVKPNGNGGWTRTNPEGDIRRNEVITELLPLPDKPDSMGYLCKIPVYREGSLAGYIVNTEFYNMYPNSIAYMGVTSSQGNTKELQPFLLETNSLLQIISQDRGKVVMEFDNADNVNTKFNVYDIKGVVIRQVDSKGNLLIIDDLPSGVYFIKCETNQSLQTKILISN